MPIYEYQCEKCGHQFETLVLGQEKETPKCPKCGHENVARRLSTISVGGGRKETGCAPSGSGFS